MHVTLRPERLLARRGAGILLHLTSLPRAGDAFAFIDFLSDAGFDTWAMLPLGPLDASGSPYHASSLLAAEPTLVPRDTRSGGEREYDGFRAGAHEWLDDYALFMALREHHGGAPWSAWSAPLRDRDPDALADARRTLGDAVERHARAQYAFERWWTRVRAHAQARGVRLFGDMPFYPALDSADVWADRALFDIADGGAPRHVAGVPPDYFAEDGQRWGNPVYAWEREEGALLEWWARRLRIEGGRFDLMRIDHFRALDAYWRIPADARTARDGAWVPAPGAEVLAKFAAVDPRPELVAEDLGTITPEVHSLRDAFGLPGMRVLQFGFDGHPGNPHHPAHHVHDAVVYTGTHDNDTALGWWRTLDDAARTRVRDAAPDTGESMPWALIDIALASPAALAVIPMQDLLGLGADARMNTPGTVGGNWRWRMGDDVLTPRLADGLRVRLEEWGRYNQRRSPTSNG